MNLDKTKIINKTLLETKKFSGVSIDSRNCKRNDLFFAIEGEHFDGHNYVKEVFRKGVAAAVVNKKWKQYRNLNLSNKSLVLVENTTKALGELARSYRKKFLIPVLAVAGSNGKTTARDMIAAVLSRKYHVLRSKQNLNNQYGVPLTLFCLRKRHEFCVLELGTNHFGEIEYLCRIAEPQFGVLTNIAKEHLEFFKDLKGVAKAEGELVEYIRNNYGTFFLNKDDSHIRNILGTDFRHYYSYSSSMKADVTGKIMRFSKFYPVISVSYGNRFFETTLSSIGTQSFNSALCAAAIGSYFEVPVGKIKDTLAKFRVITKRRNELIKKNGIWIIDDSYNSNPDSVQAALENLKRYRIKGEIHVILGDMLELGAASRKEHRRIGKIISELGFQNLYTFGPESYATYLGAKQVNNNFYFSDKHTLVEMLTRRLKKNDLVLVKGSHSLRMDEVVDAIINS